MKNLIVILLSISLMGMLSCKKTETTPTSYEGKWSLVFYNPSPMLGSSGSATYGLGDVVWDFDLNNQTVNINVNTPVSVNPLSTGNYSYQLGNHACNYGNNQYFTVNNGVEGIFILDELTNNKISITAECLDGPILKFER